MMLHRVVNIAMKSTPVVDMTTKVYSFDVHMIRDILSGNYCQVFQLPYCGLVT